MPCTRWLEDGELGEPPESEVSPTQVVSPAIAATRMDADDTEEEDEDVRASGDAKRARFLFLAVTYARTCK